MGQRNFPAPFHSVIDTSRDGFQLAQPFAQIGDFNAACCVGHAGVMSAVRVDLATLQLDPFGECGEADKGGKGQSGKAGQCKNKRGGVSHVGSP